MNKKQHIKAYTKVKDGEMVAIASTEGVDRVGDSLKLKDWDLKNFTKNPVLQAGHDYRPQFTIGIAENMRVEGKELIFTPKFHSITPLATQIAKMYKEKFLTAWSVGFVPGQEKGDKNELLEVSAVAVPANPEALTNVLKGFDADCVEGKDVENWIKKELDEAVDETAGEVIEEEKDEEEPIVEEEDKDPEVEVVEEKDEEEEVEKTEEVVEKAKKGYQYKERFNKTLSKTFDIDSHQSTPSGFEFKLYTKYLECKVKNIFQNNFFIPSPLIGSYLKAFKTITSEFELKDTRNFNFWDGAEMPPISEVIKVSSKEEDDFLIVGTQFLVSDEKEVIIKYEPNWFGMDITITTNKSNRKLNKKILADVEKEFSENNCLKGEKFALSGEFLDKDGDNWDEVLLEKDIEDVVKKTISGMDKKKEDSKSRGMLFMGSPGNGKTKTGRVIMNELDSTFIWVSSKDFQRIGPIQGLSLAFDMARKLAPSVLFVEDIDTWMQGETTDLLKTEMDGIKQNNGVITILTSNTPEKMPDALLDRPGRFHDVLEYKCPDEKYRKLMIEKWLGEIKSKDLMDNIIKETEGYSGAHMKELIDFALITKEEDELDIEESLKKSLEKLMKQREIVQRLRKKGLDIDEKSGKVISKKNKSIIQEAITTARGAVEALEKLLEADTSEEKSVITKTPQVRKAQQSTPKGREIVKPKEQKKFKSDDVVLRALQKIAGQSSYALNKIKNRE